MFYTYLSGSSREYFSRMNDAWEKAAEWQLRQGKDLNFATVYEAGNDRIRVQFCHRCSRATPWEWIIEPPKRHALAFCAVCGNNISLAEIVVDPERDFIETLAMLFEQRFNVGFSPTALLNEIQTKAGWERWTIETTIQYVINLFPAGVVKIEKRLWTKQRLFDSQTKIRSWLTAAKMNELRTRTMELSAIEKEDNESNDASDN